jgi:hypothetical protein
MNGENLINLQYKLIWLYELKETIIQQSRKVSKHYENNH